MGSQRVENEVIQHAIVTQDQLQQYSDQPEELVRVAGLGGSAEQKVRVDTAGVDAAAPIDHCHLVCIGGKGIWECFLLCH